MNAPKTMPVDFIRQVLEQTLSELKNSNPTEYFGGDNEVHIVSFYEQLKTQAEVDRFTETYRELTDQQNRMEKIGVGVVMCPDNPTYTNLYTATVIPMTWSCNIRCNIANRDKMISTINALIEKIKGTKLDIGEIATKDFNGDKISKLFKVGTIANGDSEIAIECGDYFGEIDTSSNATLLTQINEKYTELKQNGIDFSTNFDFEKDYIYCYDENESEPSLVVVRITKTDNAISSVEIIEESEEEKDIVFPTKGEMTKWKLSMSCESISVDEPRTLNSEEFITITFGGSATLVNGSIKLGNDIVKVTLKRNALANTSLVFTNTPTYLLEPLELTSGQDINSEISQLVKNNFKVNTHANSIGNNIQYSFIVDKSNDFLKGLYRYARYGYGLEALNNIASADVNTLISPNLIWEVSEYDSSWGEVEKNTYLAKIDDSIDIENTEGDVLTIKISMKLQGSAE